jgi:hypothetical protein
MQHIQISWVIEQMAKHSWSVSFDRLGTANLSAQAHFTERLRRIGTGTLQDAMTIEDPVRFTRPWQVKIRYARLKDLDRMIPTDCEFDRNTVGDEFGIAPPR